MTVDLPAALAAYREHGFARLGPVLTDAQLGVLRERAVALMLGTVKHEGLFFQLDAPSGDWREAPLGLGWQGPALTYRKLEKLELDEEFRSVVRSPALEPLVRALVSPPVLLYRAIVFNKAAEGGSEIPWHQDAGKLWGVSKDPSVQVWIALDDAPVDGGCLQFVPGSHGWGLASPLGGIVGERQVEDAQAERLAVSVPVRAGEAVLLHNLVWHRSGKTRTGQRRLAFSACYLDGDTRCVRKHKAPRRFFRVFEDGAVTKVSTSPGGK